MNLSKEAQATLRRQRQEQQAQRREAQANQAVPPLLLHQLERLNKNIEELLREIKR